jgi:glycosyltransferase involved in cell wall biosynthesis
MKVDLVMWTKNGSRTLPRVMTRIDKVIPEEFVNRRLIVDDRSTDDTKEIAESFGWHVVNNEGTGISDAANTALKNVSEDYFVSFEQDLLLSYDWWEKIPPYLKEDRVAVASGMRFASKPAGLRKLQEYELARTLGESKILEWLRAGEAAVFTFGKSLDNTIYKTRILRLLGGFPKMSTNSGVDTVLAYWLRQAGYHWIVNYCVQSVHLREALKQELYHHYSYGSEIREVWRKIEDETGKSPPRISNLVYHFFISPFSGSFIALKTMEPSIAYIGPLLQFYSLKGLLHGK